MKKFLKHVLNPLASPKDLLHSATHPMQTLKNAASHPLQAALNPVSTLQGQATHPTSAAQPAPMDAPRQQAMAHALMGNTPPQGTFGSASAPPPPQWGHDNGMVSGPYYDPKLNTPEQMEARRQAFAANPNPQNALTGGGGIGGSLGSQMGIEPPQPVGANPGMDQWANTAPANAGMDQWANSAQAYRPPEVPTPQPTAMDGAMWNGPTQMTSGYTPASPEQAAAQAAPGYTGATQPMIPPTVRQSLETAMQSQPQQPAQQPMARPGARVAPTNRYA